MTVTPAGRPVSALDLQRLRFSHYPDRCGTLSDRLARGERFFCRLQPPPCVGGARKTASFCSVQGSLILMAALQEPVSPRGVADFAKDFAIMVAVSILIIAGVVVLKMVLPPIA